MTTFSHLLKHALGMLTLLLCIPLAGMAQDASATTGVAPHAQRAQSSIFTPVKGGPLSVNPTAEVRQEIEALHAEMKANVANPDYDMYAAFRALRKSPYVVYPLGRFEAGFPLIYRTGDLNQDKALAQEALTAWKATH